MHMARGVWTYGLTHEMVAAATAAFKRTGRSSERTSVVKPLSLARDFDATQVGCVVALLNAEAADPTELLTDLTTRQSPLFVVYLIEQPATKVIVEAMRKGAVDVIEYRSDSTCCNSSQSIESGSPSGTSTRLKP